jgi:EmrB/QacA subfamily drug resistance transporter
MSSSIRGFVNERRRWVALIVVCFAMLMNTLDQTIVNVALPTIQHDLHFTQASLAWVIDAYLITFAGALLLAGRLGDLIGRKKVFLVGVTLFTLSSAACGAANTQALLVGARFAQGLGAALSSSVILAIIVADFPIPAERAKAMSSYIIVAVGGGSLGLLVGGYVTQALSWHWIFFINIPIGIATIVLGAFLIDENAGLGIRDGLDVGGAVLSTGGLMLAIYAIVSSTQYGWDSTHTLAFGGAALVLLAAFVLLESRLTHPLMPMPVLRSPGLLTSSLVRGLMVVGMYSTFFIGVLYFQHVLGYNSVATGLAFLPQTLMVAVMSTGITARIIKKFGPKPTSLAGLVVVAVGLVLFVMSGPSQHGLLPADLRRGTPDRLGGGRRVYAAVDHRPGRCARQGRGHRFGHRQRVPTGVGSALGSDPRGRVGQPYGIAARLGKLGHQCPGRWLPPGLPRRSDQRSFGDRPGRAHPQAGQRNTGDPGGGRRGVRCRIRDDDRRDHVMSS